MTRYSTTVLQYARAPRNAGAMLDADVVGYGSLEGHGPSTQLYLKFVGDLVQSATFNTFGCGAAIASASRLSERIVGRSIDECRQITAEMLLLDLDGLPHDKKFCAEIAVAALHDGIRQWSGGHSPRTETT